MLRLSSSHFEFVNNSLQKQKRSIDCSLLIVLRKR